MQPRHISLIFICLLAATRAQAGTFYDALKSDPQHRLIMRAVESDSEGKIKKILTENIPITAFVPTDSAFIKAAVKMKLVKPQDSAKLLKNHCLIAAILKQHMVPGVYDTTKLAHLSDKPSMLVTKKMVPNTKGKLTVSWPLKFSQGANGELVVASVAKIPDPNNPKKMISATTGTLISPMDVRAGNGVIHNINSLLLPMTNLTRLMQVTGCPMQ